MSPRLSLNTSRRRLWEKPFSTIHFWNEQAPRNFWSFRKRAITLAGEPSFLQSKMRINEEAGSSSSWISSCSQLLARRDIVPDLPSDSHSCFTNSLQLQFLTNARICTSGRFMEMAHPLHSKWNCRGDSRLFYSWQHFGS